MSGLRIRLASLTCLSFLCLFFQIFLIVSNPAFNKNSLDNINRRQMFQDDKVKKEARLVYNIMNDNQTNRAQIQNKRLTAQDYVNKPSLELTVLKEDWREEARIFNLSNIKKRFLTIGIPTIRRVGDEYILKTISSIVNCTIPEELSNIYIVVFLADFDKEWRCNISRRLFDNYSYLINMSTLHIIESWESFYPPLNNLTHTYNDNYMKRKWRSKQNVDYAFLFLYSQSLSTYYIQMEDDIYTISGYLNAIRDYILEVKNPWICLEFSELGFIGKLYHSYDLEKLAKMVLLFYEEQPCDFTFLYFNIQMLQFVRYIRRPTIFQHVGIRSSLPGKIQPLKDRYFDNLKKTYKGDNPPARIFTNMPVETNSPLGSLFPPEMAYNLEEGYFWSKGNGHKGEWFTVVFEEPQSVEKIFIDTGSREHPDDKILHGKVEVSLSLVRIDSNVPKCANNIFLGMFENGSLKIGNITSKLGPFKIQCLSIILTDNQNWWIIIKEIAVFLKES